MFKLTLPHRIVHTHLAHLIDTEFEIAVSANASHSWQGTIAPRRNKDRSEYTLQVSSPASHADMFHRAYSLPYSEGPYQFMHVIAKYLLSSCKELE